MPRKQKREQRKGRQRVMRQLRADQCEDDENDHDAREQIFVDRNSAVAGTSIPVSFFRHNFRINHGNLIDQGKKLTKTVTK